MDNMYRLSADALRALLLDARNSAVPIDTLIGQVDKYQNPVTGSDVNSVTSKETTDSSDLSESESIVSGTSNTTYSLPMMTREQALSRIKAQIARYGSEIGFVYELIDMDFEFTYTFTVRDNGTRTVHEYNMNDFSDKEAKILGDFMLFGKPQKRTHRTAPPGDPAMAIRPLPQKPTFGSAREMKQKLHFIYLLTHARDGVTPPDLHGVDFAKIDFNKEGYFSVMLDDDHGLAHLLWKSEILGSVPIRSLPRLEPKPVKSPFKPSRIRRYQHWKASNRWGSSSPLCPERTLNTDPL